jgi:hypothetical protein
MEEWCFLEKGWEEVEVAGDEEEGDEPSEGMGADRKSSSKGGEGQRNFGSGYPGGALAFPCASSFTDCL